MGGEGVRERSLEVDLRISRLFYLVFLDLYHADGRVLC